MLSLTGKFYYNKHGRVGFSDTSLGAKDDCLYLGLLEVVAPERKLYLAVSDRAYRELFEQEAIQLVVQRYAVRVIVVDVANEEIVKWTN